MLWFEVAWSRVDIPIIHKCYYVVCQVLPISSDRLILSEFNNGDGDGEGVSLELVDWTSHSDGLLMSGLANTSENTAGLPRPKPAAVLSCWILTL